MLYTKINIQLIFLPYDHCTRVNYYIFLRWQNNSSNKNKSVFQFGYSRFTDKSILREYYKN